MTAALQAYHHGPPPCYVCRGFPNYKKLQHVQRCGAQARSSRAIHLFAALLSLLEKLTVDILFWTAACAQVRREGEEQPRALHPVAALLSHPPRTAADPKPSACAQVRREGEEQPRALHRAAALLLCLTKFTASPMEYPIP